MSHHIENNQTYQREWLANLYRQHGNNTPHMKAKKGICAGFEYAVQPNGSSLAEKLWEQQAHQVQRGEGQAGGGASCHFQFFNQENTTTTTVPKSNTLTKAKAGGGYNHRRSSTSLSLESIGTALQQSAKKFEQQSMLPPEPKIMTHRNTGCKSLDHKPVNSSANDVKKDSRETLAPFSPPLKKRNRHNAVYGQHLPTAMNSPGCAAKVFGQHASQLEERSMCKTLLRGDGQGDSRNQNTEHGLTDEDGASASMDFDYSCGPTTGTGKSERSLNNSSIPPPNPYNSTTKTRTHSSNTISTNITHQTFPQNLEQSSRVQPNPPDISTSIDDDENDMFANIDVDQLVAQHTNANNSMLSTPSVSARSTPFNSGNNNSSAMSSFHSCRSYTSEITNDNTRANCVTGSSSSSAAHSHSGPFHSAAASSIFNPNDEVLATSNSFFNHTSTLSAPGVQDAPSCPGHNEPCRIATAQTEANRGRQFYTCSRPQGEQCDFFQWVDGMEGNLNGSIMGSMNGLGENTGDVKDIFQENRRKFGHHSFREGQKGVIQNAVNGRDVFVLMPTGGGKSLCYQLPAWCCSGLAVIISPLLSLIEDQVQSMTKLGVETVFLSSTQDYESQQRDVIQRLRQAGDHGGVKMLYITPEKLTRSAMIRGILKDLDKRNLISRFVVDEAHCLR